MVETELRLEAERSYLSYAMSVIVGRALPDVRDGLKPVQRRILYAMGELGLVPTKPHRKCARVVGEVLGKYHPHGDASVYDALVRMAQPFSLRGPLVAGHGNFGSVDDDPPAAMRYTECRLAGLAQAALLADLGADTVDFAPNFDASQEEPEVLPSRLPILLLNGAGGIAVGIATKIPPHNMRELVAGLKALIADPDITCRQLMGHIPAPDFPTGGQILVNEGIQEAYETGRGTITVRAKVHIEDGSGGGGNGKAGASKAGSKGSGKPLVVITELPYQVYKASLVETIARLVEDGVISGVSDVRDESDRTGMRIVVEVKRGASAVLVENALYKHTQLQTRFPANMVALVGGAPRSLGLKDFLHYFLEFRCEVVARRGRHELGNAQKRLHLVEGFLKALESLDDVISVIRKSKDAAAASVALQQSMGLSAEQASGVLAMSLGRLTGLEEGKLREERKNLQAKVAQLESLLGSREQILQVVASEADELASKYGDGRRSALVQDAGVEIREVDTIPNAPCVITYSKKGYIKRMPAETFSLQARGGRGKAGARLKGGDSMDQVLSASTHDALLVFTEDGQVRSLPAYQVPEASRTATGTPIAQLLSVAPGTRVSAMLALSEFPEDQYLLMLTEKGLIKKTPLAQFTGMRANGLVAIRLRPGDRLLGVERCTPACQVLVGSSCGSVIRFRVDDDNLRPLARQASGVVAIRLKNKGSRLVGMCVISPDTAARLDARSPADTVDSDDDTPASSGSEVGSTGGASRDDGPWAMLVTARGLGKRVPITSFRIQARGGAGTLAIKLNDGDEAASLSIVESHCNEEVLLATSAGVVVRTSLASVSVYSRAAKGVRLVKLGEGDELQAVTLVPKDLE